ncbi:hypothetical protein ACXY7D_15210 [Sphingomonas melonis]|uniref:Uncharacterized protein n=1 Tax=Sphingomonas turrisvirgatae TaxID=1888892 RepID=A0A1E3LZI5_9SPHN|nr:hypothetical protein [Sphingomonas turrisvirgatae]ODP39216.1 hypothetical protein BFL28_11355 [Sphingomonas turrisvirgatae]
MIPLRSAVDISTGELIDRDMRRARLLAARRKPIGSIPRRGILSGHWDGGNVVGAFRGGRGSFIAG